MAYRAEIEIGVKGARQLKQLQEQIKDLAFRADVLQAVTDNLFPNTALQSVRNYANALNEAKTALSAVEMVTDDETEAIKAYVTALGESNAAAKRQNDLIQQEITLRNKAKKSVETRQRREEFLAGPGRTLPAEKAAQRSFREAERRQARFAAEAQFAKDIFNVEKNFDKVLRDTEIDNLLRRYQLEESLQKRAFGQLIAAGKAEGENFDKRLAQKTTDRINANKKVNSDRVRKAAAIYRLEQKNNKRLETERLAAEAKIAARRRDALGSAIIGGAFPLLFGQGTGAAVLGGAGGAAGGLMGGQFGFGLSLVGTALGTAVDQAVQKLKDLAAALGDPTATLEKLEEAGYKVDFSLKKQVETLLESGNAYEAQKVALDAVNASMGPDAVAQLATYEEANQELQSVYQDLTTELNKELLPALIQLTKIAARFAKAIKQERQISATPIPGFKELPGVGKPTVGGVSGVIQDMFSIFGPNTLPKVLFRGLSIAGKTGLTRDTPKVSQEVLDQTKPKTVEAFTQELDLRNRINTAIKAGNDLTEKTAYEAARQVIFAEERLALQKAGNNENRRQLIEKDRINKLDRLKERRDKQVEALRKKGQGTSDRDAKALERSRKTGEAIIRRLDQELAIKRARNTLEEDILRIEFNREREQLKINGLKDKELKDAATIRNNEVAALATVEAQVQAKLRLANLNTKILTSTKAFSGDPSQGPAFSAGIGLDVMGREKEALDEFLKKYKQVGEAAQITGQLVTFGFRDMVAGVKSAEQVFADFLNSLADMLLKTAQEMIARYIAIGIARMFAMGGSPSSYVKDVDMNKSFFGGGGGPSFMEAVGFGGFMANGGPVSGGTPYMVGERGPELFVPSNSGTIVPNNALGGNVSIVVNVTEGQTDARGGDGQANQLGKSIAAAVQSELIKQKRPGGLLAR